MSATSARVAIIGAGPAGLRAAETLARAGLRPVLIDEADRAGGQVYRQPPMGAERPATALYGFEARKATALHALVDRLGASIDYRPATLAWNITGDTIDLLDSNGFGRFCFDRLVIASGAMDRVLPFEGWTLPGVFTLGAAQIALKAQGVSIGKRVALVGAGPLLPLIVHQYLKAGANVVAGLDATSFAPKIAALPGLLHAPATLAKGLWYTTRALMAGRPIASGVSGLRAEGETRVEGLAWTDARGGARRIDCDAIGASFGLRSETQLADLAGCRFSFDPMARQWLPVRLREGRSSRADVYLAGDGAGIGGADVAELSGERAALALLDDLGHAIDADRAGRLDQMLSRQQRFRTALERAYPYPHEIAAAIRNEDMVCRCEGVTAGTLRAAARERDISEMNQLKAATRCGMGRCQGRVCGGAAAEVLAAARGLPVEAVGRLRGNAPVKPIPLGEVQS